jgi:hypothetical protein
MPSGNEFVQKLSAALVSNGGLNEQEYVDLWRMYNEMNNLAKYGLSTQLTLNYAELDQSLRTGDAQDGWKRYQELGGATE